MSVKRGDYILCEYEGKEYTGQVLEVTKKNTINVQICISSKRAEKPIFEQITINASDAKPILN